MIKIISLASKIFKNINEGVLRQDICHTHTDTHTHTHPHTHTYLSAKIKQLDKV